MLYEDKKLKLNWESEITSYKHFDDLGNYVVRLDDADYSKFEKIIPILDQKSDAFRMGCTASCKINKKGEVIIGRNMDVEISQNPAYITKVKGGKYETMAFTYMGLGCKYNYSQLKQTDEDEEFISAIPYFATDAMNDKGLYAEVNMREMDDEFEDLYCKGTNPGKQRVCMISAATLVALNCKTVKETLEFLNNSYDWCSLGLPQYSVNGKPAIWNLALIVGDATGEFGLFEFGMNGVYYTPYANGQGNYYIHPALAEYTTNGTGYGRFAATLTNLSSCETEWDMLHNMEDAMWKNEILKPGSLGYSDFEKNINNRRTKTQKQLQEMADNAMEPLKDAAEEYYKGNEKPLRDKQNVWTTSFNFGVNCHTKHLILRLWEKDSVIVEYQW